ncbi:MAG: PSD1 and planctomycete cytochrome C domain-containing protein [Planctomycetota bacterium]|nr:PSD1 and planctomycete cytochrome C domain-containing protein [Planctomycetota bacterium]
MQILAKPFFFWCFVIAVSVLSVTFSQADDSRKSEIIAHFEHEIRPVLIGQCIKCHSDKKQEGGLRLDTLEGFLKGGDSGPTLVPGNPEESVLMDALHYDGLEMPPTGKLAEKTILQFERWIAEGAVWPTTDKPLRPAERSISDADRQWWAFVPVKKTDPPIDGRDEWSKNTIDRFVWKGLSEHEMEPAPIADKTTLIRRLYFDLIGLPPSPAEIDAFVCDESPNAIEQVIDRLLADSRYGEHWARFWLDLVRYAESDGWNKDEYRPHLWKFRDYVVAAFNKDMPYPKFVLDQLAGDESAERDPDGLIAAGFLRLGIYEYNQRDARGQWNDIMNEMTDVAGDVFLGLSMSCARCHFHKFDPIPQTDYFKLRAFFEPVCWRDDLDAATDLERKQYEEKISEWEKATQSIREQLAAILEPYEKRKWASTAAKFPIEIQACFNMPTHERTSWQEQMAYLVSRQYLEEDGGPYKKLDKEDAEKREALQKELAAFDHLKPSPLREVMTVTDFPGLIAPTTIPDDPRRQSIPPGFLDVLSTNTDLPAATSVQVKEGSSGRRTALAKWIGDARNPLTTRVIVNRIWQQHFGQGLVSTSSDFGSLGDKPTHPELLDWLTANFVEEQWSFKKLHKQILLSATWQQSSRHPQSERYQSIDSAERLLWRTRVRRLQAEQIRDAILTSSGQLSNEAGGPSVAEDKPRRSLYVKSIRNQNDTFLHGFDIANGLQSVAVRDTTTTPTQSLMLLNGNYALAQAKKLAERLLAEQQEPEQVLRNAFRWTWGTEPTNADMNCAHQFFSLGSGEDSEVIDPQQLTDFCHILFNSNQFLYLE